MTYGLRMQMVGFHHIIPPRFASGEKANAMLHIFVDGILRNVLKDKYVGADLGPGNQGDSSTDPIVESLRSQIMQKDAKYAKLEGLYRSLLKPDSSFSGASDSRAAEYEEKIAALQAEVSSLQHLVDDAMGDSSECDVDQPDDGSMDDGAFSNDFCDDDRKPIDRLASIERLTCPFQSSCIQVLSVRRLGPASDTSIACSMCGVELNGPQGKYGRWHRSCSKHGRLCMPCALQSFRRQFQDSDREVG